MVAPTPMSAKFFEKIAHELGPCELVRGEVVRLSPGGNWHSVTSVNATLLLGNWARKSRRGRVLSNEPGVITQQLPDTVRGADVIFCSYKRIPKGKLPRGFSRIPPELVVEVVGLGKSWRSLVEKAAEYLAMGVDRVWVISPETRRLHILRPDAEPQVLTEKQKVTDPEILPGFSCVVRQFFED